MTTRTTARCTALLGLLLAGCQAPPSRFPEVARSLGATTLGSSCPFGAADLTSRTIDAWQRSPRTNPHEADFRCAAIEDDLTRDSTDDCTPDPDAVFATPLVASRRITGELFYMGLFPREYAYDLHPTPDGGTEIELRIQFRGALVSDPREMAALRDKLTLAATFWTRNSPQESKLRFHFEAVTDDTKTPHFLINLDPGAPRTPYDVTWGNAWGWHLIAHEVGHILDKESAWAADPSAKIDWFHCDLTSVMCDSKGKDSAPSRYHYYVVLRRRFCRANARDYPRF